MTNNYPDYFPKPRHTFGLALVWPVLIVAALVAVYILS